MVAVIDGNDVVHIVCDTPDDRTVGATWCSMYIDWGIPAQRATVMWVERTSKAPTCLTCIHEHGAEFDEGYRR